MKVKKLSDSKAYEAANHRGYHSMRLYGLEEGGPQNFTVGMSHFLPGGGAGPDASPLERVYVVLAGKLTLLMNGQEYVLGPNDSCYIAPNETREIINRGNDVVTMMVVMPPPPKAA